MNIERFIATRLDTKKYSIEQYSKIISKLCILAIASSIAIIIISICTGKGLEKKITSTLIELNSNITIENYVNSDNQNFIKKNPILIQKKDLEKIRKIPNVSNLNPVISTFGIISNNKKFSGIILNGVDSTYNWKYLTQKITDGQKPSNKSEILISSYQAKKLNLKLKDTLLLSFLREKGSRYQDAYGNLIISGFYKTNIEDFDQNICFVNLNYLQKKIGWKKKDSVSYYQLFLNNESYTTKINNTLNNEMDFIRYDTEIKAFSIYDKYPTIFNWINLFKKNITLITFIMLVICLINITNFLIVMVIERTKMIALLKSFGASNYQILKIFFFRLTKITIQGLLFGNLFGFIICGIQKTFNIIKLDPSSYFVTEIPIYFDFYSISLMNFLILILIPISIMMPYHRISKLSLSNSLKIK